MGIDMLVVDDGWFGRRDDDTSSLGVSEIVEDGVYFLPNVFPPPYLSLIIAPALALQSLNLIF
jgi:hypothetical protein